MSSTELRLSVALVTRNRPESLRRALISLRSQSIQPAEVIVSDDSGPCFSDVVRAIAEEFSCRYTSGPCRGLYANRNHAAASCGGTHIRSMDDDHEFPDGHLARVMEAIRAEPDAIWVVGEIPAKATGSGSQTLCPGELNPRGTSSIPPNPDDCWAIADGATVYPRKVFDKGIRLVEDFKFGASYLEFGDRLHWLGFRIRLLPGTVVIHHSWQGRSYSEPMIELASSVFAMLCHSWLYHPTIKNRALTFYQLALHVLLRRGCGLRAIAWGLRVFQRHKKSVASGRRRMSR